MIPSEENNHVYISWDSKFELGIPVIDNQHKKLVTLRNSLYNELIQTQSNITSDYKLSLTTALQECVNYVKVHFKDEETILKAINYVNFNIHKKHHEEFIKELLKTSNNFDTASFSTCIHFVRFLYDWILSHIAHEDKLYVKPILEYYAKEKNK